MLILEYSQHYLTQKLNTLSFVPGNVLTDRLPKTAHFVKTLNVFL
jgi:hypothetical protein